LTIVPRASIPSRVLPCSIPGPTAVHVVQSIWRELGIDRVLGELQAKHGRRQPFERALFAMVGP